MIVNLTQIHIDYGVPKRPSRCAIALALLDATGEKWTVNLSSGEDDQYGQWTAFLSGDIPADAEQLPVIPLPPIAADFAVRFDRREPVSPITFEFPWTANDSATGDRAGSASTVGEG